MFFVRSKSYDWCTTCAMDYFVGIRGEAYTAENIRAFIINVQMDAIGDKHGGTVKELPGNQLDLASHCVLCDKPLSQLLDKPVGFREKKIFTRSAYNEWVPMRRPTLSTDLDPVFWNRTMFAPFEYVIVVKHHMRILLVTEEREARYGTILYATNDSIIMECDEKRRGRLRTDIVCYPLTYPGLYVDSPSHAHYQAILGLSFSFTFGLLSDEERREQWPFPYTWKYGNGELNVLADTKREAIENLYIALCHRGHIDDSTVMRSDNNNLPF